MEITDAMIIAAREVIRLHSPKTDWPTAVEVNGQARAAIEAALAAASASVGEPFGYYCECKGADPGFLRPPAYIPPTDDLHITTPLYLHPAKPAEPVAWRYEFVSIAYGGNWQQKVSLYKPKPSDTLRNITPLYIGPVAA